MRLIIAAVGRLKDGPERVLIDKYRERLTPLAKRVGLGPVTWQEIGESRSANADTRCTEEGAVLLKLVRDAEFLVALDERGKAVTSAGFAQALAKVRDGGAKAAAIVAGGPGGL